MSTKKYLGWAAILAVMLSLPALAAGILTNGLPTVNTAATGATSGHTALPLTGNELIPADTQLSGGRQPQSEAISVSQLATFYQAPVALTDATTVSVDASLSNLYTLVLSANSTLDVPSNVTAGKVWRLRVAQSGGSHTLGFATGYAFAGGTKPTISTPDGQVDILTFIFDGTSENGSIVQNLK